MIDRWKVVALAAGALFLVAGAAGLAWLRARRVGATRD